MTHAEAAEVIKSTVSMREAAGMLGFSVRKDGFMVCPFHGDTDASLKIYDMKGGHSGWHCFGCGRGGSVIDFVMESEGCGFRQAVREINDRMGLGLLTVEDMFTQNTRQKTQRIFDQARDAFDMWAKAAEKFLWNTQHLLTRWLLEIEGKPAQERTAQEWTRIQLILEEMKYNDYLLERTEEIRREVSQWRSKARSGSP